MSSVYRVYRKLPGSGWWKAWSQFNEWARITDEMMSAYGQGNCAVRAVQCRHDVPFVSTRKLPGGEVSFLEPGDAKPRAA
jgi:hypothetical protein